jgi:predicted esterase
MRRALLSLVAVAITTTAKAQDPTPWCAPELESLPGEVCFHEEPARDGKRTLVIFLHGLVQEGSNWQHAQQRGIVRGAKRLGFSVLAPRGRAGLSKKSPDMVAWPTSGAARDAESALIDEWQAARRIVEQRSGAFDEVFVVGFSNGAYYGSSLALRGRLEVDGYAVFAGGVGYPPLAEKTRRAPVFVGICSKDATADDARDLAATLVKAGWPHRAESRKVGHAIADAHLDHAVAFLRER